MPTAIRRKSGPSFRTSLRRKRTPCRKTHTLLRHHRLSVSLSPSEISAASIATSWPGRALDVKECRSKPPTKYYAPVASRNCGFAAFVRRGQESRQTPICCGSPLHAYERFEPCNFARKSRLFGEIHYGVDIFVSAGRLFCYAAHGGAQYPDATRL